VKITLVGVFDERMFPEMEEEVRAVLAAGHRFNLVTSILQVVTVQTRAILQVVNWFQTPSERGLLLKYVLRNADFRA
jgi:hypothetical protein